MYLSIPEGMKFARVDRGTKNAKGEAILKDCFIDPKGVLPVICLQDLLKDALQSNTGRLKIITKAYKSPLPFTIYTQKPPSFENKSFLQYIPNKNGKEPTTKEPTIIKGMEAQQPKPQTHYGQTWDMTLFISAEKAAEIAQKKQEQRDNRRHVGDSPFAT